MDGERRDRLTAEILWSIPRVGAPACDKRGTVLVVPLVTYGADSQEGVGQLWRIVDGVPQALTQDGADCRSPAVSPDGSRVAFVQKVEGVSQIHLIPIDGGESIALTDFPLGAMSPQWTPDGSAVVCLGEVFAHATTFEDAVAERARQDASGVSAHVTEQRMYRYWDRWLTDGRVPHLYRVTLDGTVTDLTPDSVAWWRFSNTDDPGADFDIAPDGSEVAYAAVRDLPDDDRPVWGVFRVGTDGSTAPELISEPGEGNASRPRYTPDGSSILYGRQRRNDFYADRVRLVRFDRSTGTTESWLEHWDRSPSGWEFGGDGTLVFAAEDDARTKLYLLGDAAPEVLTSDGTASSPRWFGTDLVFLHDDLSSPPELYRLTDGAMERLTVFTADRMEGIELGETEDHRFVGADGDVVQMYVLRPPGFDPDGPPPPLVHNIHGGPHGMSGDTWHWRWNAQAFAAPGQVVAMVNFHGSTSWGQAFTDSIQGSWGNQPMRDIDAATDHLVSKGLADPDRVAVAGGSYGGYLVAWIVAHTDRYRCAVAHAAVTNLGGMYASDVTFSRAVAYGAEYWVDRDRVDLWSPSAHAEGHTTPTLVIHGDRDYRVPVTQGLELYGVLRAKGVRARLVHYPDENHWILKRQNSIHWYGEVLGWLERHFAEPTLQAGSIESRDAGKP